MKLIIDIPEEIYNDCKVWVNDRGIAMWQDKVIADGIPYEERPREGIDNKSFDKEAFINWVESFNWTPEETRGWETFKLMLREYRGINNNDR